MGNHDGDGLHLGLGQQQGGQEVVVPGLDKGEDELHGERRLEHGENDEVEGD